MKFTPVGGRVNVGLHHDPGADIRITVSDTGIGMSEADIPRALERFSQVESGLRRRFEGTGLGLPLAQTLAALHGGRIGIESSEGEGTTVHVHLPEGRIVAQERKRSAAAS